MNYFLVLTQHKKFQTFKFGAKTESTLAPKAFPHETLKMHFLNSEKPNEMYHDRLAR